ncbi:MAG: FkbM family methyltransferase [Chloroflexota bacterium]|nr:FkbM family methyltransferase [Chloroflexota bacterium]
MKPHDNEQIKHWLQLAEARLDFKEFDFHSNLPVFGRAIQFFRQNWNNVSTRWYVRFLAQQQTEFNATLIGALQALAGSNQQQAQTIRQLEQQILLLKSKFNFRPGSQDEEIFLAINDPQSNEYQLPEDFAPEDIVFDIGMHVGSFSYGSLSRGAGQVYGFEALPENFELASRNLAPFGGQTHLFNRAIWRSDQPNQVLPFHISNDKTNTGGGSVVHGTGQLEVQTLSLDEMLNQVSQVRLLKIDAEGSEFPILFTCTKLDKVQAICGEFHEIGGTYNPAPIPAISQVVGYQKYTVIELESFLRRQGFSFKAQRDGKSSLGKFWAWR